jgi:nitrous oxide reductase accessory protein NosL
VTAIPIHRRTTCHLCGQYVDSYTVNGPRGQRIVVLYCPRCDQQPSQE